MLGKSSLGNSQFRIRRNRIWWLFALPIVIFLLVAGPVQGQEGDLPAEDTVEEVPGAEDPDEEEFDSEAITEIDPGEVATRHRLDLGLDRIGLSNQSITTLSLGYTWAPGVHSSLLITTNFLDPEGLTEDPEDQGLIFGDTIVTYSWAGKQTIFAKPWLPSRFGSGIGLVIPTGSPEKVAGLDMWVALPFLGLVKPVTEKLVLLPTFIYGQSFAEGDLAIPMQMVSLEVGLLYELSEKWWLFYRPTIGREFELSETIIFNLLQVGRTIGARHGISLEFGTVSDEVYSLMVGFRENFNQRITLRAHLGFR